VAEESEDVMDLGPHAVFILASYGIVTMVIGALIGWMLADGHRQRRLLAEIEAESGHRRGGRE
jgi:heme exporter protein D